MRDCNHYDRHARLLAWKGWVGGDPEVDRDPGLIWSVGQEFANQARDLSTALDRERDPAMCDGRFLGMELQLERRDDAEVGAGAAHSPEEVGIFVFACMQPAAVGRDQVDGPQVIDREAELALEAAHAAAEGEARDAGMSNHSYRASKP